MILRIIFKNGVIYDYPIDKNVGVKEFHNKMLQFDSVIFIENDKDMNVIYKSEIASYIILEKNAKS